MDVAAAAAPIALAAAAAPGSESEPEVESVPEVLLALSSETATSGVHGVCDYFDSVKEIQTRGLGRWKFGEGSHLGKLE